MSAPIADGINKQYRKDLQKAKDGMAKRRLLKKKNRDIAELREATFLLPKDEVLDVHWLTFDEATDLFYQTLADLKWKLREEKGQGRHIFKLICGAAKDKTNYKNDDPNYKPIK